MDTPLAADARRRRQIVRLVPWLAAPLALLVLVAVLFVNGGQQTVTIERGAVVTAQAQFGGIVAFAPVRFLARPKDLAVLTARQGGRVLRLHAKPGERVRRGAVLAELEDLDRALAIRTRIAQTQSELAALNGQQVASAQARSAEEQALATARYNVRTHETDVERKTQLADAGFLAPAAMNTARSELEFNREMLASHEAGYAANERLRRLTEDSIVRQRRELSATLAETRRQLDEFTIRAPVDGVVQLIAGSVGDTIASGARFIEIDPGRGFELVGAVDELYAGQVKSGQTAEITHAGRAIRSLIREVQPAVEGGVFRIVAEWPPSAPAIASGIALAGRLAVGDKSDGVWLPNAAFMRSFGGRALFVVSKEGVANRRAAEPGLVTPEQVAFVKGLKPGETVIVSDYADFEDARRVLLQ